MKNIDWESLPLDEHIVIVEEGRKSAARKAQRLLQAAGLAVPGKRGRPAAGAIQLAGEDLESADEDDVSAAAQ